MEACSCPGVRLQGVPELVLAVGEQWSQELCEVWPDQVDDLLSLVSELREDTERLRTSRESEQKTDWLEPFPTIPNNMHQPAASPEGKNPLPPLPPAWRREPKRARQPQGFRGDKDTVNQISVRSSRWIPSQALRCPQYVWGSGTWGPDTQQWGWRCIQAVSLEAVYLPPPQSR